MKLFPSQTKEIFELIKRHELEPTEFELTDEKIDNGHQYLFKHKGNSELRFFLYVYPDSYAIEQFPGLSKYRSEYKIKDFFGVKDSFTYWLNMVKNEKNSVDYFEYYKNLNYEIPEFNFTANDNFTADELLQLDSKLNLLIKKISTLELLPHQIEKLSSKIKEIKMYAKTMTKLNWWELFIGALISCIISQGINSENAKLLWDTVKDVFSFYLLHFNAS